MNLFVAEHPMAAQKIGFDAKQHPKLRFLCCVLITAIMLTPLVLAGLYFQVINDIGAESTPFPEPLKALFFGGLLSFIVSSIVAVILVSAYWWVVRAVAHDVRSAG
jgi:hypothetical protein